MKMSAQKKLVWRLIVAVLVAFAASMVLTWLLHENMSRNEMDRLVENVFDDVEVKIREKVDQRLIRQAMTVRDRLYMMRTKAWWTDPDESSRQLRALADELGVDEICVADAKGMLTHSARREEVGALDFVKDEGQAHEFAALLTEKSELTQPLLPNSLRGEMVKYVGVWIPDGGFVQIGCRPKSLQNLARTAVTGLTHGWHVSGDDGGIYITTSKGTIISHPENGGEGGQWRDPGEDFYCQTRAIEGFPVYIAIPKKTAIVERRVLVATSAFLNGMALILAAFLVGIVIASYVRGQIAAQVAKEMAMASEIQESAIPRTFPPFPGEHRIDIFASMLTAKDVGGDFYDFYFSGQKKVTFLVADVSGKGIPAALFMMRAKASIKGIAQTGKPLAEVVTEANEVLSRDNGANMFVTAWIGEIDLDSGIVTYVNAGHNPPLLISPSGETGGRHASYFRSQPGVVLGVMPGIEYKSETVALKPGDALYLYTDGITEQPDRENVLFGEERLADAIDGLLAAGTPLFSPDSKSPILGAVLACIKAHALDVEQADDCTQLILRYNGSKYVRRFAPTQQGIAEASAFLDATIESLGCVNGAESAKMHIVLDEIASNVVKHSCASHFEVELELLHDLRRVKMTFADDGKAFDSLAHTDPDTTLPASDRAIGGLGIMMVKRMAAAIAYNRRSDRNVLTVELAI